MELPDTPILVVGATGTVGGAVLADLLARQRPVRALVRHGTQRWPTDRVDTIVGDLGDPKSLDIAMRNVSAAFYISPHADDEVTYAGNFLAAAARNQVRVVFAGVHVSTRAPASWARHQLFRIGFPAYRAKLQIGRMVERSDAVILVPSNFFDNDELFLADIAAGSYPTPLRFVNRVAVTDIAAAAGRILTDPAFPSGTYPVVGPRSWTGPQCARVWSDALARPVTYTGDDADTWQQVAARRLPPGRKGQDFRASFRLLGRLRMATDPAAVAITTQLLGRPPLDYPAWVGAMIAASTVAGMSR